MLLASNTATPNVWTKPSEKKWNQKPAFACATSSKKGCTLPVSWKKLEDSKKLAEPAWMSKVDALHCPWNLEYEAQIQFLTSTQIWPVMAFYHVWRSGLRCVDLHQCFFWCHARVDWVIELPIHQVSEQVRMHSLHKAVNCLVQNSFGQRDRETTTTSAECAVPRSIVMTSGEHHIYVK